MRLLSIAASEMATETEVNNDHSEQISFPSSEAVLGIAKQQKALNK